MYLLRGIILVFVHKLLLIQISGKSVKFEVEEIVYEYDDEINHLGENVYKGTRKYGNEIEEVAFKESSEKYSRFKNETELYHEKEIYEMIGDHGNLPKFYHYFPKTNQTNEVLITELLGETIFKLSSEYDFKFSDITLYRICLQVFDALEHLHRNGIKHNDLHFNNIAVGLKNNSNIYIFDFGESIKYKPEWLIESGGQGEKERRKDITDFTDNLLFFTSSDNVNATFKKIWQKTHNYLSDRYYENPLDYMELQHILRTEIEKHKKHPNYNQFEWQTQYTNTTSYILKQNPNLK